jgi:hypothetical protein
MVRRLNPSRSVLDVLLPLGFKHFFAQRNGMWQFGEMSLTLPVLISLRIVPNYELAPDLEHVQILRVVVRENFSETVSSVSLQSVPF